MRRDPLSRFSKALRPMGAAVVVAALLALLATRPALGVADVLAVHRPLADFDLRSGLVPPTPAALAAAESLAATVRWNRFGTPHVLFQEGGFLSAPLAGSPAVAAREWLRAQRDLFGLSESGVEDLEVVRVSLLPDSDAQVVLFGQRAGSLPLAHDGRIKVALAGNRVFWVSSSAVGEVGPPGATVVSAAEAWLASAAGLGLPLGLGNLLNAGLDGPWRLFEVPGLSDLQRVRPVALALPGGGVLPAFETIVLDVTGGGALAYTSFVDGLTGQVLIRRNRTWQLLDPLDPLLNGVRVEPFNGVYQDAPNPQSCGPRHGPYRVGLLDPWARVIVEATAALPTNDVFLRLYRGNTQVAQADLGTSPEVLVYQPSGGLPKGDYFVEVCPFAAPSLPATGPYNYLGAVAFTAAVLPDAFSVPRWKRFAVSPLPDHSSVDTRIVSCWSDTGYGGAPVAGCDEVVGSPASRAPWDLEFSTGIATRTTTGNNALSALSWVSPLTPSIPLQPLALDRDYDFPWNNAWHENRCNPLSILQADVGAAVANLFAAHNRMHDWSYFLGFTEVNGNAQLRNFGLTPPLEEADPEIGNAQAGALTGGFPSYLGRDNANQITLNDGIAPITNMYLWQPVAGTAYPPCVDGDFDMAIIAHEYGHMIQSRMVDPDNGLAGDQGRAMGESWSDLTAIEYLNGLSLVPLQDENPFAVGAYATGDKDSGVRNYPMNDSPLNFSNLDYDPAGLASASPHSNGEIWSAVNFDLREALIAKYDTTHPAGDVVLQKHCADGEIPAFDCPGNRRWAQIFHDAFLLMPSEPTMVDARDAYLAADQARMLGTAGSAWPSNQAELWQAFARRGLGRDAASAGSADVDPTPSFASPVSLNADVSFVLLAADEGGAPVEGEIFVGQYEARSLPVADTLAATPLSNRLEITAGTYDVLIRAEGYGHRRQKLTFAAGQTGSVVIAMPSNWAALSRGTTVSGDGTSFENLVDESEATTWEHLGASPDVAGTTVTVELAGRQDIGRAQVSAMIEPEENRFEALRAFRLEACDETVANCDLDASYTPLYTSAPDAFSSGPFRPGMLDWQLREFTFPPAAATHVRLVVLANQCTGNPDYQRADLDDDPLNETDCRLGNAILAARNRDVTAAELQLFSQ